MADREQLMTLATDIVSSHVSNNAITPDQLPTLIQQVFNSLATVEQKTAQPRRPDPAVPIKQSAKPGYLVCLECGRRFSMIKRHLMSDHQLTPQQYRARWELPASYPLVAANYGKVRSTLAKKFGLGRTGRSTNQRVGRGRKSG
jgi:predicted transcriptional regulator